MLPPAAAGGGPPVGVVQATFLWHDLLQLLLPPNVESFDAVLSSESLSYTFHVGANPTTVAGDAHDPGFTSLGRSATARLGGATYNLTLYPDAALAASFVTQARVTNTSLVCGLAGGLLLVLAAHEAAVAAAERRAGRSAAARTRLEALRHAATLHAFRGSLARARSEAEVLAAGAEAVWRCALVLRARPNIGVAFDSKSLRRFTLLTFYPPHSLVPRALAGAAGSADTSGAAGLLRTFGPSGALVPTALFGPACAVSADRATVMGGGGGNAGVGSGGSCGSGGGGGASSTVDARGAPPRGALAAAFAAVSAPGAGGDVWLDSAAAAGGGTANRTGGRTTGGTSTDEPVRAGAQAPPDALRAHGDWDALASSTSADRVVTIALSAAGRPAGFVVLALPDSGGGGDDTPGGGGSAAGSDVGRGGGGKAAAALASAAPAAGANAPPRAPGSGLPVTALREVCMHLGGALALLRLSAALSDGCAAALAATGVPVGLLSSAAAAASSPPSGGGNGSRSPSLASTERISSLRISSLRAAPLRASHRSGSSSSLRGELECATSAAASPAPLKLSGGGDGWCALDCVSPAPPAAAAAAADGDADLRDWGFDPPVGELHALMWRIFCASGLASRFRLTQHVVAGFTADIEARMRATKCVALR